MSAIVEPIATFLAGAACLGTGFFLVGLLFIETTESGWRIRKPW